MYKDERGVLEEEMREIDKSTMEECGALDNSEKMIAVVGDGWWPQAAKEEGDIISKRILCNIWK